MTKDTRIFIRLPIATKAIFLEMCKKAGVTMSQKIRNWIEDEVDKHNDRFDVV